MSDMDTYDAKGDSIESSQSVGGYNCQFCSFYHKEPLLMRNTAYINTTFILVDNVNLLLIPNKISIITKWLTMEANL